MASNILSIPFRKTTTVSLSQAIKQYISTKYDQHPDMFAQDLEDIDRLRSAAVTSTEPHNSGIKRIQAYAAQLVWLGGKFPIDIGCDFTWYPSLGYNTTRPISQNNIRFELANLLFNLAAMYSQLAVSANRSTSEGLKVSCNYSSLAAGVISYLKSDIMPDLRSTPPEDMDTSTLESLEQLMLAQAQESFWQKAVKDGKIKDGTIAKLAAKVSDYYSDAGDHGTNSNAISSEWLHHMNAKHHHFAAAAQYRAALDCLEKRKYGEEIARLHDSLVCINTALKEQRYINKAVLADLNGIKSRVTEDLKRAEKDNDMLYLLPVPAKSELKTLDRADMVKAIIPKEVCEAVKELGVNHDLGRPLFTKLVPYAVHVAASIYADRRDRLVNSHIVEELEGLNAKLRDLLKSLNLPGSLQALEKPLGLPPSLMTHAEEIRQQDGIDRLYRSIKETEKLKDNDKAVYHEGVELLRAESAEDERARTKYGTDRWNRPTSEQAAPHLFKQIKEIDGYLKSATNSDQIVQKKLEENSRLIELLSGTDRDLERYVPSSRRATMTPVVEREANKLRACLDEVSRLESRRRRKIEAVRAKAKQDDVNSDLLREAARLEREYPMQKIEAVQFEGFFDKRLQKYDTDKAMVEADAEEQQALVKQLQEANVAFVTARQGDNSTKERERVLQSLENAYMKYREIIQNSDVGRKFYNDLAKIVGRFRDDCRTFVYQRRAEAQSIENDITTAMSSLNINHQASNLHQQRQAPTFNPPYSNPAPAEEPLTAPQPTRGTAPGMWTPEMGIKFAGVTSPHGTPAQRAVSGTKPKDQRWDQGQGLRFG